MGVGLLSLPYTMRLSGWVGLILVGLVSAITCYSALLLGRIMNYVPKHKLREGPGAYTMYGFHDMGMVAFGTFGKVFISCIFIIETFG
jgi:vesicular inhibitory amino acid transporter